MARWSWGAPAVVGVVLEGVVGAGGAVQEPQNLWRYGRGRGRVVLAVDRRRGEPARRKERCRRIACS